MTNKTENVGIVKNNELLKLQERLLACEEGERGALKEELFDKLYPYYKNMVGSVCKRYNIRVDKEKGQDMFNDIYVEYLEGLGQGKAVRSSFAGYLYGKISDVLFRRHKKEERETGHSSYLGEYQGHNQAKDTYAFIEKVSGLLTEEVEVSLTGAFCKFLKVLRGCGSL